MSVPIATSEDEFELEDNQTKKKQKKGVVYYPIDPFHFCQRCVELEERVPEEMPMAELNEYLFVYVKDDEGTNLRIAHYYKKLIQTGGFEIDCPPHALGSPAGFLLNKEHFVNYLNYETMYDASIKAGIDEYIDITGNQMTFVDTENVTVGISGSHMIFFLTMECSLVDQGTICNVTSESSSDPVVDIYQSVVSYDEPTKTCAVWILRRKSDGEDLIEPDPRFACITRPEKPVPEATKRFIRDLSPY
ncbi:hypothetical protein LINPERHAP1_LOCUS35572 [Linum perenne]